VNYRASASGVGNGLRGRAQDQAVFGFFDQERAAAGEAEAFADNGGEARSAVWGDGDLHGSGGVPVWPIGMVGGLRHIKLCMSRGRRRGATSALAFPLLQRFALPSPRDKVGKGWDAQCDGPCTSFEKLRMSGRLLRQQPRNRDEVGHIQRSRAALGVYAQSSRASKAPGNPLSDWRSIFGVGRRRLRLRVRACGGDAFGHRLGHDVDDRGHDFGRRGEGAAVDARWRFGALRHWARTARRP